MRADKFKKQFRLELSTEEFVINKFKESQFCPKKEHGRNPLVLRHMCCHFYAGLFLAAVSGVSALIGFGTTIAGAKKRDPEYFGKGMVPTRQFPESGSSLALRALGWGTLYAFTGCGLFFYGIWKLSGAQDLQEFRIKMGNLLPRIPKNIPPQGRTEFSGMNDLLEYLSQQKSNNKNNKDK